jgi:magnesium transporter
VSGVLVSLETTLSCSNVASSVRAILDANRNALMLLDLKFSVGTLGLAMGTFLAGLYGMNLENFIEETNWGFGAVTGASMFFSVLVCWYGLTKLRKVQRVRMMGDETGSLARNKHWFRDDGPLGLLEARNREKLRRMNMQKTVVKKGWLGS